MQTPVDANVDGLEQLRAAVAPFVPAEVARRAGIDAADLVEAARVFAGTPFGYGVCGVGPNMSGEGTLIEYLLLCIDTVCGHWMRAKVSRFIMRIQYSLPCYKWPRHKPRPLSRHLGMARNCESAD
jgi:anaerobic selenocysteine-containing dehydrogenase